MDLPVVAARSAGSAPAMLGDGRYGLLVDPDDPAAMARALLAQLDPATALRPGDRVAAYSLAVTTDAWAGAIEGLA